MKKKFKVHTFGCRTNKYESQAFLDQLLDIGYKLSDDDIVDFHIVNTCAVTSSAEKASKAKVSELLAKDSFSKIIITGCSAPFFKWQKLEERIIIVPNADKEKLISILFPEIKAPLFKISNFLNQTRAFVKIQDGCNNFCSYCIIPFVRGRSRSRPLSDILDEVKALVQKGFNEIVLTGINIGDYLDGKNTLADLVKALDYLEDLERIRLSSIDPDKVDENLLYAILNGKKTSPSMHLSLQSGSDKILKKMNRNYSAYDFLSTVDKIKSKNGDFTFTTDIIVGFPGETDEDFNASLDIVKNVGFAKVHMFPFSRRKGTIADKFDNQVPRPVIIERKKTLLEIADKSSFVLREKFIGRKMKVLLEKETVSKRYFIGHSENFLTVKVDLRSPAHENNEHKRFLKKNMIIEVMVTENSKDGLIGSVLCK